MKSNKLILIAVTLSILFSFFYIFTNRMPEAFVFGGELMDFFNGIALATIAAGIFYLFQIIIPENKRKQIVKDNFKLNYTLFKEECIAIFLSTLGTSYNSELQKKLSNLEDFKTYFKGDFEDGQSRWDGVLNGLNDNQLKDLLLQFEILVQEIDFFLNNVSLHDEEVFSFFKRLKIIVHSLKYTNPVSDELKTLSGFLWELFSGWGFIGGYRKNDIFEEMLEKA